MLFYIKKSTIILCNCGINGGRILDKKNKMILLIVAILIILGSGGYMVYSKNRGHVPPEYEYSKVANEKFVIKTTEGYESEVINLSQIEDFIKNVNEKNKDNVSIIEYMKKDKVLKVSSLTKLDFDGEKITLTYFNTENEKKFEEEKTETYEKIVKIGDNTSGKIVALRDKLQSPIDGQVLITYQQSNVKEYK